MSETPVDRQTVTNEHRGEPIGSAEAVPPGSGSRSLKAGGEFLRALGADLGAVTSRVRLSLAAKRRRPQPPPAPTPTGAPPGPGFGRGIWRVGMVFFGALVICSGLLSAAMLYVIFGSPLETRHGDPGAPALRAEAPSSPSLGPSAEATIQPAPPAAAAEQQKSAEQTKAAPQAAANQLQPASPGAVSVAAARSQPTPPSGAVEQPKPAEAAEAEPQAGPSHPQPGQPGIAPVATARSQPTPPSGAVEQPKPPEAAEAEPQAGPAPPGIAPVAAAPNQPIPRPADGAAQQKPAELAKAEPPAGSNQPQPGQPEISAKLTDQRPGVSCNLNLCAAAYKSFHAADCTYQPIGSGPRSVCELGAQPTATSSQISRAGTDPSPKATDTRTAAAVQPVATSAAEEQSGSQCNRSLCGATYKSFHATDCTYQPEGGGPRSVCDLGKGPDKGPADALQQPSRTATDSKHSLSDADDNDDMPAAGMAQQVAEPATVDRDGPQCNRSRCAATYQSFHASDCTYQPEGGGPRRLCEP